MTSRTQAIAKNTTAGKSQHLRRTEVAAAEGPHGWESYGVRAGLLVVYGLLVLFRVPAIVVRGRFWAEEGSMYFASAFSEGFWWSVFAPRPGYYMLFPNVATAIAAHFLPLEHAPRFTVLIAFFVQLLPAVLILTTEAAPFDRLWTKVLALALVLLSLPNQEILLTTVNSQFHMLLCAALVLILPAGTGARRIFLVAVLLLAGLSGIGANFLVPLFWFRAYQERSSGRLQQAAVLTVCAIVQGLIVLIAPSHGFAAVGHTGGRSFSFDPWVLSHAIFAKHVLLPLFGVRLTEGWMRPLAKAVIDQRAHTAVLAAVMVWLGGFGLLTLKNRQWQPRLLYVAALLLTAISCIASVEAVQLKWHLSHASALGAGRYYYVPNVCFALTLLALGSPQSGLHKILRRALLAIVMWILVIGAYEYARSGTGYRWFFTGPDWQQQIAAWRAAPGRDLMIWPVSWKMTLPPLQNGVE